MGEVRRAFVEIHVPLLLPPHHLLVIGDGVHRAIEGAPATSQAEVINGDINRFIVNQRQVSQDSGDTHAGTEFPADQRAVLAQLPQSRIDRQRDMQDVRRLPIGLALLLHGLAFAAESRDLILVAGQSNAVGADAYAEELPADPKDAAKEIAGRVAFWKGVRVVD